MSQPFAIASPKNHLLQEIVDYYFYIDIPVAELSMMQEYVIPFPRITFGYFFDHPFRVINHTIGQQQTVDIAISRLSTHRITVAPLSSRVRIIGAHVRPFALAYMTERSIGSLPWIINPDDLFALPAQHFRNRINRCLAPETMLQKVEEAFLDTILTRDLGLISRAVGLIDKSRGAVLVSEVARKLRVSDRTLRNHFNQHVGCSPKEYTQLVKLKQATYQMYHSDDSLTTISYDSQFADQAHFINTLKSLIGKSPKRIRQDMPHFRFLQF